MKTTATFLSLIFLLIQVSICNATSLNGKISDVETGKPLPYAKILVQQSGKTMYTATSDITGSFVINSINSGRYAVKVTINGYLKQEKTVTIEDTKKNYVEFKMVPDASFVNLTISEDNVEEVVNESPGQSVKEKVSRSESAKCGKAAGAANNWNAPSVASDNTYVYEDFNTEEYDAIHENGFLASTSNPLSTFSVDVDKAAYSNVRRFLNGNTLPQKDVVRIEEMINYFDYDYPQPKDETPFSINMELGDCPWNSKHSLLHIGLKGLEMDAGNIPATNLVFLLDVSGSMNSPNKLPLLKSAFKILIDKLRPQDRISIVVYAGAAGIVLEPTSGANKETIIAALDKLEAGGSTAGGAGIELAYKIAKENFIQDGNNRVILATDGDFNIGQSSDAAMERLIEEKRKDGVFLTVLGFGMGNYKDAKMEKLSNAGNGNYAYIDNLLEAKKVLGEEIWGTLYTIAKDVKFQIEFNPAVVQSYRLIGYENRMLKKEDFNDDKKDAGEIGAGHTVTALYEIVPVGVGDVTKSVDPLEYQSSDIVSSSNMMTVKLRYKEPDGDVSKLVEKRVKASDIKKNKPSINFAFSASVAEFGMLLRDSEHKAAATYDQVLQMARSAKGTDDHGYRAEFIKLVEVAQILGATAQNK